MITKLYVGINYTFYDDKPDGGIIMVWMDRPKKYTSEAGVVSFEDDHGNDAYGVEFDADFDLLPEGGGYVVPIRRRKVAGWQEVVIEGTSSYRATINGVVVVLDWTPCGRAQCHLPKRFWAPVNEVLAKLRKK